VNADDAAAAVAGALGAELVLLTDTDGVRDASGRRLAELSGGEAERLIAEGVVSAGMVPKVRSATRAVENGAWRTVIADGRREGALAASLAGSLAAGTRVVR
jgi:acetylglutamate kinase